MCYDEAEYFYVTMLRLSIVLAEKVVLYIVISLAHILGRHPGIYFQGYGVAMVPVSSYAGGTL